MTSLDKIFTERHDKVLLLRAQLCKGCKTEDDLVMIASLFMFQSIEIYEELGGKKLAATQLYGAADRVVGEMK